MSLPSWSFRPRAPSRGLAHGAAGVPQADRHRRRSRQATGGCTTGIHRRASLPGGPGAASIAPLMLDSARTQTRPAADPAVEAGAGVARAPRAARARARAERLRTRAEALASQAPGYAHAAGVLSHDRRNG